ncbi:centromere protein S-like [Aphomia sociella]
MANVESLSSTEKIRAAIHRDVRSVCSEACHLLGLEITKPAMALISELLYKKLTVYGMDLEAFAKHAKRSVINSEDVKLLVRRNPSLRSRLENVQLSIKPTVSKDKRRKTVALPASKAETPTTTQKSIKNETIVSKANDQELVAKKASDDLEMDVSDTIDLTFD